MQPDPTFIGIDISKLTLDICQRQGTTKKHWVIKNTPAAIRAFFKTLAGPAFIGMENTGCYNYHLYSVLAEIGLDYYVIPPLHLKKSLGLTRGKNDKIDAYRIVMFMEANIKNLSSYIPPRPLLIKLQLLLARREQRIKIRKQVLAAQEQYQFIDGYDPSLSTADNALIVLIEQQIKDLEVQMQRLIANDQSLSVAYKLITSVQGVGKVLAWNLLVSTREFEAIPSAKKLACYAGVAPFDHSSGTSIRRRNRVSQYADKNLKRLLHLAAMSAIRFSGDMRTYYLRKVEEGKNKMSTLNAVRNKLIHRVYAVLRDQRPYQKDLVLS